jgi:glycosyltransferase involved in cell wall biosynthesis
VTPRFTLIIPTYNRPQPLTQCLEALTRLDMPRVMWEVIVVDDGTPGGLEAVISPFAAVLNLRLIVQANGGPASARNNGAAHARAPYLAFVDDDCQPVPDWLSTLALRLDSAPERMFGGHTVNCLTSNPFAEASQRIVDVVYNHFNADADNPRFFTSNNMLLSAAQFRELGGFDLRLRTAEDRDLCDRWKERGWELLYVPEAVMHHAHNLTLRKFFEQHFNYGRGAYTYHKLRRARLGKPSVTREMGFHRNLDNWLLYPLRNRRAVPWPVMLGLLALWEVANLAGYLWQGIVER